MIHKLILKARKQANLLQSDVSDQTKISIDRLGRFENGIDCLTVGEFERLLPVVGLKLMVIDPTVNIVL